MSLVLPSVQAREWNRVALQTQWWCSYVFANKPRLCEKKKKKKKGKSVLIYLRSFCLKPALLISGEDSNIGGQKHFIFGWTVPFKGEVCYILQYEC